jgi:adenylate cyclase
MVAQIPDHSEQSRATLEERLASAEADVTRLSRELAEALEQRTALGEVLRVIASSPTDLQQVLDALVASAAHLCRADHAVVQRSDGDEVFTLAATNPERAGHRYPVAGTVSGRVLAEVRTIHVHSSPEEQLAEFPASPGPLLGIGAQLSAPLLRGGEAIGVLGLDRYDPRPFSDSEIALLETFADQAVIAIENARLFEELRSRTDELAELNQTLEDRVREQVDQLERVGRLRRYLSPQLAELIVSSGDESILETHRRQVTVVFCDLRGFTAFAEMAEPEEVMGVLGQYHAAMGDLIRTFEGTFGHFAGDGLMTFFNDPLPQPDHVERAVRMACAMRERAAELARGWRRAGHELDFGVGVAVGYATLGRIGFEGRYDYDVIGTVANLAARLCAEATGGQILIPARVHGMIESLIDVEPAGELTLKGLHRPVVAFNITGLRHDESLPLDHAVGQATRDA